MDMINATKRSCVTDVNLQKIMYKQRREQTADSFQNVSSNLFIENSCKFIPEKFLNLKIEAPSTPTHPFCCVRGKKESD